MKTNFKKSKKDNQIKTYVILEYTLPTIRQMRSPHFVSCKAVVLGVRIKQWNKTEALPGRAVIGQHCLNMFAITVLYPIQRVDQCCPGNIMPATDIFNFLVTTLKRQKEAYEKNSDHIFYLTQSTQHISSISLHCLLRKTFLSLFSGTLH